MNRHAASLSIITNWRMRLAATLFGVMFFLWVVAPPIAASPHNRNEWNGGYSDWQSAALRGF